MSPAPEDRERLAAAAAAGAVAGWTAFWVWRTWAVSGLSWHFFTDGGRALFGASGLHLYADHPELQVGPLALAVAAPLRALPSRTGQDVALLVMTVIGLGLLLVIAMLMRPERRVRRLLLGALVFVPSWVVLSVRWGHLDDVLAMAGGVLAVYAVRTHRPLLAGVVLGAAVAAKPWAVGFLPLVVDLPAGRLRAAVAAATTTTLAWLPFVLGDTGTLTALRPPVALVPGSGLHTLGVRGAVVPGWGRTAQLLLVPAVALVAALRGRWAGVLLVAVAVRIALDPQDNAYYVGSAALAALVLDLLGTRWTVPWATLATVLALWQPFVVDYPHRFQTTTGLTHWWFTHPTAVGVVHLAWAAGMVALVLLTPPPDDAGPPRRLAVTPPGEAATPSPSDR